MGEVAPLEDLAWYDAEVWTVLSGERSMGASMLGKLTDAQRAELAGLATIGCLDVERHTYPDGQVEVAWAPYGGTLDYYWSLQERVRLGNLPLEEYWTETGALFGYSVDDVAEFVKWISVDPCPCPCPQCRPDLFKE